MESVDLLGMDFVAPPTSSGPQQPVVPVVQAPAPESPAKKQEMVAVQKKAVAVPVNRQRKFNVRCEGRWRVRAEPSLSAKVVGTVANGTTVYPVDDVDIEPNTLWIRVSHFEANKPG